MLKLKTHSGFHDLFRFWYVYEYKYGSILWLEDGHLNQLKHIRCHPWQVSVKLSNLMTGNPWFSNFLVSINGLSRCSFLFHAFIACISSDWSLFSKRFFSTFIKYSRAGSFYHDFLDRPLMLTRKLLNQGLPVIKFESFTDTCHGRKYTLPY
jgi:hypothetical protein